MPDAYRCRHLSAVRSFTPSKRAMSDPATPSAIISRALARRTIRCSAFALALRGRWILVIRDVLPAVM